MPKVLKSTCRKLWCLSACKKSNSSLTYFLRHCKDIANLPFWELWECLIIPIKIIVSICSKLSCLSACKKSIASSSLTSFLRYCKKNSKLVILGNLGMPGHTHLIWSEFFEVYQHAKNQLHPSRFSWNIAKILQACCFGFLVMHAQSGTIKL